MLGFREYSVVCKWGIGLIYQMMPSAISLATCSFCNNRHHAMCSVDVKIILSNMDFSKGDIFFYYMTTANSVSHRIKLRFNRRSPAFPCTVIASCAWECQEIWLSTRHVMSFYPIRGGYMYVTIQITAKPQ
jgi:hypothetical protein